jgi:hypothetical protein
MIKEVYFYLLSVSVISKEFFSGLKWNGCGHALLSNHENSQNCFF